MVQAKHRLLPPVRSSPSQPDRSSSAARHRRRPQAPIEGGAVTAPSPTLAVFSTDGQLLSISRERQELVCSVIGLTVKLALIAVAGVSLMRLAGAYQQRMDRQGEITAVLELETAKLAKARERFDSLFRIEGEQRLIREQSQWIAPNRLRVVWRERAALASVAAEGVAGEARQVRP
jgi:hypothetical protein